MPAMVKHVCMAHGVLFVAYVVGTLLLIKPMNWGLKQIAIIFSCSFIPFEPFYVGKKYL